MPVELHLPRRANPRLPVLAATLAGGAAALAGGGVAPGVPALLARIEALTGWPMLGLDWAIAIGGLAAWVAQLRGLETLPHAARRRAALLGLLVLPLLLPGAGRWTFAPGTLAAGVTAVRSAEATDGSLALLLAGAVLATAIDPRLAPAGAVATLWAAARLAARLRDPAANDNAPGFAPVLFARAELVAPEPNDPAHLQGSWPQFMSE